MSSADSPRGRCGSHDFSFMTLGVRTVCVLIACALASGQALDSDNTDLLQLEKRHGEECNVAKVGTFEDALLSVPDTVSNLIVQVANRRAWYLLLNFWCHAQRWSDQDNASSDAADIKNSALIMIVSGFDEESNAHAELDEFHKQVVGASGPLCSLGSPRLVLTTAKGIAGSALPILSYKLALVPIALQHRQFNAVLVQDGDTYCSRDPLSLVRSSTKARDADIYCMPQYVDNHQETHTFPYGESRDSAITLDKQKCWQRYSEELSRQLEVSVRKAPDTEVSTASCVYFATEAAHCVANVLSQFVQQISPVDCLHDDQLVFNIFLHWASMHSEHVVNAAEAALVQSESQATHSSKLSLLFGRLRACDANVEMSTSYTNDFDSPQRSVEEACVHYGFESESTSGFPDKLNTQDGAVLYDMARGSCSSVF